MTSMDLETKAKPQRQASEVEPGCQMTEAEPVGQRTKAELEERWSPLELKAWKSMPQAE